jgi:hypothetical protein
MKLATIAIQQAAQAYEWEEVLHIFADHFRQPDLAAIPPYPRVYAFSLREYWLTDYEEPYPMAHVLVNCGSHLYICDFDGLHHRTSLYRSKNPFVVKFWRE